VLVAGGSNGDQTTNWVDLYDPVAGTWTSAASMNTFRRSHSATLLPDGTVLVTGGDTNGNIPTAIQATTEIYDPASDTWTLGSSLASPRAGHTATLLKDGGLLVAFGNGGDVVTEIGLH
jgi:hypothetical protein